MRIDILTLFPEMFAGVLGSSILHRASRTRTDGPPPASFHLTNIRDHTNERHGKVDQPPYGGGPGMVLQCQPIWDAVRHTESLDPTPTTRIVMTPRGPRLGQSTVERLAVHPRLLIIAGHYEGIDERVLEALEPIQPLSIGDYVITGGELAAMVLVDAVVRLLPGVLGDDASPDQESFSRQTHRHLEHPQYTRPRAWKGLEVPEELLSGNHARIKAWQKEQTQKATLQHRPDLLPTPQDGGPDTGGS